MANCQEDIETIENEYQFEKGDLKNIFLKIIRISDSKMGAQTLYCRIKISAKIC